MALRQSAFTQLETDRLILRRFADSDLPAIFAYRNDCEVAKYQSWTATGEAELRAFIHDLKTASPGTPGEWFQFAIELKSANGLIGDCALKVSQEDVHQGEVGFTLSRQHQGKGFATEAVSMLLDYAFTKLGLHRVIAITDCDNRPSIVLLERLHMRREGRFLQSVCNKGEWRDEYSYAILKDEWVQRQNR